MTPARSSALRTLAVLLCLHVGVKAVSAALAPAPPGPAVDPALLPARVLTDSGGAIRDAVVQVDPRVPQTWGPIVETLSGLDPGARIHVLCSNLDVCEAFRERATRQGVRGPERFDLHPTGRAITGWARDRFTVRQTEAHGPVLVAPPEPAAGEAARLNDWRNPWVLGRATQVPVHTASFRFDGGDLAAGPDVLFATEMLWAKNREDFESREDFVATLRRELGLEVVLLGDEERPIPLHHIGMFLTPVGGRTVVVGDAGAGAALLRSTGRIVGGTSDRPEFVGPGGRVRVADFTEARLERFRNVARGLHSAGFEVVPLPLIPLEGFGTYITYNNVLVDQRPDGQRVVFLPTYRLPALDAEATRRFERLGFEVHPVDVTDVYEMHGSVRCLVNVLRRDG